MHVTIYDWKKVPQEKWEQLGHELAHPDHYAELRLETIKAIQEMLAAAEQPAPLRTRAEVDAERLLNLDAWRRNVIDDHMLRFRDERLAREETAPEPEPIIDCEFEESAPGESPCNCDQALALKKRVEELDCELELRRAEWEASNAELRRRIRNLGESHELPRVQDVAKIHELEQRIERAQKVWSEVNASVVCVTEEDWERIGEALGEP